MGTRCCTATLRLVPGIVEICSVGIAIKMTGVFCGGISDGWTFTTLFECGREPAIPWALFGCQWYQGKNTDLFW